MSSNRGRGRGGRNNRGPLPRNVQVSKKLSWLLRHGAESEGLKLDSSGFINLKDVINNRKLQGMKISFEEVEEIVRENDKQRFTMIPVSADGDTADDGGSEATNGQPALESQDPKDWKIRANQGHSLKVESEDLLQPITAEDCPSACVHGTSHVAWPLIVSSGGLKPMDRNHIHFAPGLPAGFKSIVDLDINNVEAPVISGMRKYSTILIFIDVLKAMEAGFKFWRSDNGVILNDGGEKGLLPLKFFKRVEDRSGAGVLLEDGKVVKEAPKEWGGKGKGKG